MACISTKNDPDRNGKNTKKPKVKHKSIKGFASRKVYENASSLIVYVIICLCVMTETSSYWLHVKEALSLTRTHIHVENQAGKR